jgi:hypothetical protein
VIYIYTIHDKKGRKKKNKKEENQDRYGAKKAIRNAAKSLVLYLIDMVQPPMIRLLVGVLVYPYREHDVA